MIIFSPIQQVAFSLCWLFPLLCRSVLVWCNPTCLFLLLLLELLVSYPGHHCQAKCHEALLCFLLGVVHFYVLCLNLQPILSWFFFLIFIYLFIYLWLCWVFVSVLGLSPVVASGGHSSSRCTGLSLLRPLLLRSTGSRRAGSVIVAHGPSCSAACGILPDQGSNPGPLHWQADSQPLHHQGSPWVDFYVW